MLFQIFPRDLACMSTMMTFEYLSQLCQNKDQICSLPAELKDLRGDETLLKIKVKPIADVDFKSYNSQEP